MKIKADKNQTFKTFDIEMKPVTWQQRCELNDSMIKESGSGSIPNLSFWGKVVLQYTALTEDELNKYSTDEIVSIANAIFEEANKKK